MILFECSRRESADRNPLGDTRWEWPFRPNGGLDRVKLPVDPLQPRIARRVVETTPRQIPGQFGCDVRRRRRSSAFR
jgi:hypothetical protein